MARDVSDRSGVFTCFSLIVLTVLVGEDNPAFEGIFEFCSISAGGSIGGHMLKFRPLSCSILI